jgi:hypothetical protein
MISLFSWWKFRGDHVITCPDNKQPEVIRIKGSDLQHLDVRMCSRWPEKLGCGQECLRQVQESPEGCLLQAVYTHWYLDQKCAICGKTLDVPGIAEHVHAPALLAPDGFSFEWNSVRAEDLARVMVTHSPICWDCHIAHTFRREHPELVVERDFHR